jgi:DNA polymerase
MTKSDPADALAALLAWHLAMGVDETIAPEPVDRLTSPGPARAVTPALSPAAPPSPPDPAPSAPPQPSPVTVAAATGGGRRVAIPHADAYDRAMTAASLVELRAIIADFDGCPLKETATNLVFGDGVADAAVLCIGEAPGAEEDRQGLPFVGASGRLLDRMLASIGLDRRRNVFISNTVFWRPPGNRQPTPWEIATCQPFVQRIVELIRPRLLIALGGPAATTLTGITDSVGRLRGRWFTYQTAALPAAVPTTALFHPAYLLRSPSQKRLAWRDLLAIQARLARCGDDSR